MLKERRGRSRGGGRGSGRSNLGRAHVYNHHGGGGDVGVNPRGVYSGRTRGSSIYRGRGMVDSNLQRRGGGSRRGSRDDIINSRNDSPRLLIFKLKVCSSCFLFRAATESKSAEPKEISVTKEADVALADHKKIFIKQSSKKGGKKAKSKATLEEESSKCAVSPMRSITSTSTMELKESCTSENQEVEKLAIKKLHEVDVMKGSNNNQGLEENNAMHDWKDQLSNYTSPATGLKVLSVTSSSPGYVFTAGDRARIVRMIPGVVIINAAGKGDCLVLGVDIEDDNWLS